MKKIASPKGFSTVSLLIIGLVILGIIVLLFAGLDNILFRGDITAPDPEPIGPPPSATVQCSTSCQNQQLVAQDTEVVTVNVPQGPVCTGARPESLTTTNMSGEFMVFADGVQNTDRVYFAVFSLADEQGSGSNTDDRLVYEGEDQGNGTWKATILLENHPTTPDNRIIFVRAWMDYPGNQNVECGRADFGIIILGTGPTCVLTANPATINAGEISTLSWEVFGNATSAVMNPDIGTIALPTGSADVSPTDTTNYTLTVSNVDGSGSCSVPVTVGSPPGVTLSLTKTVDPTSANPGETLTYTLEYSNQGPGDATGVILEDDFDETKITNIDAPAECLEAGGILTCTIGDLANGETGQIVYTAEIKSDNAIFFEGPPGGEFIDNTATLDSDQTDPISDTARVTVQPGGLTLDKSANPVRLVTGQQTTYTVEVMNHFNSSQTFTLQDVLSSGNNGGTITINASSYQAVFDPISSGIFSGNNPFTITDLQPGAKVTITYTGTASNAGIPVNQESLFPNTVTLVETGEQDSAEVVVIGPTQGTPPSTGGGGGGGSRIITAGVELDVIKEVQDRDGQWKDANEIDFAALVANTPEQAVHYRVKVTNSGNISGENVVIEDVFESSTLERLEIENVKGAEYDDEDDTFMIDEIRSNETKTITYDMKLEKTGSSQLSASAVNTATVTEAENRKGLPFRYRLKPVEGIGEDDPAYIKTDDKAPPLERIDVNLDKSVNKAVVKPTEEVEYTIRVKNVSTTDLLDVVVTDLFPFNSLEFISASSRGIQKDNKIEYNKRILRIGEEWIIKVKAKVKAGVPAGTHIRNIVAIKASNADLSDKRDETEIETIGGTTPKRLQSTGPEEMVALMLLVLGSLLFVTGIRKRYWS